MDNFVEIVAGEAVLEGELIVPEGSSGIVLFAHGSGSSRHSPRNQFVAESLRRGGLATLLFDLLTPEEEEVDTIAGEYRFDIDLLTERLALATDWLDFQTLTRRMKIGYFGASTGAAAALTAASRRPGQVLAVVSRGGRPDLAAAALAEVRAATLLIVGGNDDLVIDLNEAAFERIPAKKELKIVPGATHLFEEPGALEEVAGLAADWFATYLR